MRFKFLCLLSGIVIPACLFQVDVLEPQTSPIVGMTASLTNTMPSFTATLLPFPTDTPSVVPPSPAALSTFHPDSILPIVFSPGATSQLVVGSIGEGSRQTYSLNALQGQVMSVSILPEKPEQQGEFHLEIKDRDGLVLCPLPNLECLFWRGALPSTQEYLIEVGPPASGVYSMRLAINPPGTVSQMFAYPDPQGRYSLSAADDFAPAYFRGAEVYKFPPDLTLQYIDTQQYISTNLLEVYFLVGVSDDPGQVSNCTQPLSFGGPETILGETMVSGIPFTKSEGGGVAAGNIYELVYYRALHHGSCYEVTYFVHYGNIGAYAPGAVTEFDRTALYQQLDEILASLILK